MPSAYAWFEETITALERALGARVTIIDNQGVFHTPAGLLIFPPARQSHRRLAVCACGFSPRCIDFCRHAMTRACHGRATAFSKTCWKGVTEIVVPLHDGAQHWGMLYLGAWRAPEGPGEAIRAVPEEFPALYDALPAWHPEQLDAWAPLLEAVAAGLVTRLAALHAVGQPPVDRARRIRAYLQRHADSPRAGIADLAERLHLSVSRTSRLLQAYFGRSFTALLHQERINRAKVLLLSTEDTLAAIAAATGFSDVYHFSKVFRKVAGLPPGAFRGRGGAR